MSQPISVGSWVIGSSSEGGRSLQPANTRTSQEGRSWSDERLLNLLRIFENTRGVQAIRECRDWHDPSRNTDYTDDIVEDLRRREACDLGPGARRP